MTRRAAGSFIAAATLLFVVLSFFGTANQGSIVRYESSYRGTWPVFTVTGVTAAGKRAGLRVGDVLDFRSLTPLERYRFDLWDSGPVSALQGVGNGAALGFVETGQSFTMPYFRDGREVRILRTSVAAPWDDHVAAIVSDVFTGFCAIFGALLLIRGRDRASLFGGLFLLAASVTGVDYMYGFDGFFAMNSFAVASEVLILSVQIGTTLLLYLFAESFLPAQAPPLPRWIFRGLYAAFMLVYFVEQYVGVRYIVAGDIDSNSLAANASHVFSTVDAGAHLLGIVVILALLWYASQERHQAQRVSVRVVFWAVLIGFSGIIVNFIYLSVLGAEWPLDGLLGLVTFLTVPIGTAYVVFTRNLYDVDFFVSRAALYAILLGIVVAIIALTESFLDHVALGRYGNIALSFAIPIALGLSMRWIGGQVERFLQRTLYRDKVAAHERLRALTDDFAEAHDPDTLAHQVVAEMYKAFKGPCAVYRIEGTTYLPYALQGFAHALAPVSQDDPAFMRLRRSRSMVDLRDFDTSLPRHGLLFPLTVVGRVYGALFVGNRPHDQWYDPDDQNVIRAVASELAAALLWLRDRGLPVSASAVRLYSLDQ